VFNNFFKSLGK